MPKFRGEIKQDPFAEVKQRPRLPIRGTRPIRAELARSATCLNLLGAIDRPAIDGAFEHVERLAVNLDASVRRTTRKPRRTLRPAGRPFRLAHVVVHEIGFDAQFARRTRAGSGRLL